MQAFRVLIILIIFFTQTPRIVYAEDYGAVYFYEEDNEGNFLDLPEVYSLNTSYTTTEKAFFLLEELILNEENFTTCVPNDTELLDCSFSNGILTINFSCEALNCAGNFNQQLFVEQIINTVYSIEEIRGIILLVDGEESTLPEGVDFSYFNR